MMIVIMLLLHIILCYIISWYIIILPCFPLSYLTVISSDYIRLNHTFFFKYFFGLFLALLIVQLEEGDRKQGKRGGVTRSKGTRAGESNLGLLQSLGTWVYYEITFYITLYVYQIIWHYTMLIYLISCCILLLLI